MALLDASYLQSWLEEHEYLEKLTELFERNPESQHPFKVRILKSKVPVEDDPVIDQKIKEIAKKYHQPLDGLHFYLPARLEVAKESIEQKKESLALKRIICKQCGVGTYSIEQETFWRNFDFMKLLP